MKKVLFVAAAFAALSTFSSCKSCVDCTYNSQTTKVCKSDYSNNQTLYDAAVAGFRASGYSCK